MNAHDSKIIVRPRGPGSQFATNVRCRFLCIASHPHQKLPRRLREKVQSAPVQNGSEAGASCLISPMRGPCIPWPALFLPIKNPLSCWNSEEQDRGMSHFLGKWGGERYGYGRCFRTPSIQWPLTRHRSPVIRSSHVHQRWRRNGSHSWQSQWSLIHRRHRRNRRPGSPFFSVLHPRTMKFSCTSGFLSRNKLLNSLYWKICRACRPIFKGHEPSTIRCEWLVTRD